MRTLISFKMRDEEFCLIALEGEYTVDVIGNTMKEILGDVRLSDGGIRDMGQAALVFIRALNGSDAEHYMMRIGTRDVNEQYVVEFKQGVVDSDREIGWGTERHVHMKITSDEEVHFSGSTCDFGKDK